MKKLFIIISISMLLILSGCDEASDASCELATYKEYHQDNVQKVHKWSYIVFKDGKFFVIFKGSNTNSDTTSETEVTDFIKSKLEAK